jgi:chitodextrinase
MISAAGVANAQGIVVGAAGDIACDPSSNTPTTHSCQEKATSDLLLTMSPSAVLALGDDQYTVGALSAFQQVYGPTWGRLLSITHPVPGNHEYGTSGAAGYFDYFGSAAGPSTRGYYSYDLGSWHLIALDSECSYIGGCGNGSPEETWLRQDLAAHPGVCTLAYWHRPRFSSSSSTPSSTTYIPFWTDLFNAGADLVLNGHAHDYELFDPQDPGALANPTNGVREIIVGTGGDGFQTMGAALPNSVVRNNSTFGVLKLTLDSGSYSWQFEPIAGSTFTDSGSAPCHLGAKPPAAPTHLTATPVSTSQINLAWTASTTSGVTSYGVFRNGMKIATTSGTSYQDTGLQPQTSYRYQVVAYTSGGDQSSGSTAVTATTLASTGTLTYSPTDDATVESANPTTNYGTSGTLIVDGSPKTDFLLRFNVTATCTITSSELQITDSSNPSVAGGTFSTTSTSWSQSTVNWNNAPPSQTAVGTLGAVAAGTTYSIDTSSVVKGAGVYSFRDSSTNADGAYFYSKEGSSTLQPKLIVHCG